MNRCRKRGIVFPASFFMARLVWLIRIRIISNLKTKIKIIRHFNQKNKSGGAVGPYCVSKMKSAGFIGFSK